MFTHNAWYIECSNNNCRLFVTSYHCINLTQKFSINSTFGDNRYSMIFHKHKEIIDFQFYCNGHSRAPLLSPEVCIKSRRIYIFNFHKNISGDYIFTSGRVVIQYLSFRFILSSNPISYASSSVTLSS